MDLDLSCVASFLILLEEQHYGMASRRLHVAPSTLTKRVQRLERQVGVPLLVRDTGGILGPTPAGRRFAAEAEALLAHARAVQASVRAEPPHLAVRLAVLGKLGDFPFPARSALTKVGQELRHRHPDTRLVCRGVPISAVISCLLDGTADVVWGATSTAPSAVHLTPLVDFERVGVIAARHELAGSQIGTAEFLDLPLLYNPAIPPGWMTPFYLGDVRPARDAHLVEIDSVDARAVFARVARGEGVATSTPQAAATLPSQFRVIRLPGLPPVPLYVGRRRTDRREPVLSLVDILPRVAETTGI